MLSIQVGLQKEQRQMKLFIKAEIPTDLANTFLQHLRDFDTKHKDCHFELGADTPELSMGEIISMMKVDPELTFTKVYERKND